MYLKPQSNFVQKPWTTSPSFAETDRHEHKTKTFLKHELSVTSDEAQQTITECIVKTLLKKDDSDGIFRLLNEILQAYKENKNLNLQGRQKRHSNFLKINGNEAIFLDSYVNLIENIKNERERHDLKNDLKNCSLENKKTSSRFELGEISEKQAFIKNSLKNSDQSSNNQKGNRSFTATHALSLNQSIDKEGNASKSVAERILALENLEIKSRFESFSDYTDYMSNFLGLFLDILSNFNPKTAHEFFEVCSILKSLYSDYLSSPYADPEVSDAFGEAIETLDEVSDEIRLAQENGTEINIQEIAQETVRSISRTIQPTITNVLTQMSRHIDVEDQTSFDINILFNEKESPKTSVEKVLLENIKSYRDLKKLVKHHVSSAKVRKELLLLLEKAQHQSNSNDKAQSNNKTPAQKDIHIESLEKAYKKIGMNEEIPPKIASMLSDVLRNNKEISSLLSELKTSILKKADSEPEKGLEKFYEFMKYLKNEYAETNDTLIVQKIENYIKVSRIEDNLIDFSKINFIPKQKIIPIIETQDFSPPPPPPPGFFVINDPSLSTATKIINNLPEFYAENIHFNPEIRNIEIMDGAIKKLLESEFQRAIAERKEALKKTLSNKNLELEQLKTEHQKINKLTINLNKAILNREFTKGINNLSINETKSHLQLIEILNLASENFVLGERPLFETTEEYQKFVTKLILPIFNDINPIMINDSMENIISDQVSRIIQTGTIESNWEAFLVQRIEQKIKISGKKDTIGKLLLQTRKTTSQSEEEFDSFILGKNLNNLEDFGNYITLNVKGVTDKKEIYTHFKILEEAQEQNLKITSSKRGNENKSESSDQDPLDNILNESFIECGIEKENVDSCIKTQTRALFIRAIPKAQKWEDIIGYLPEIEKAFTSLPEEQVDNSQLQIGKKEKKERAALYRFLDKMGEKLSEKNVLFSNTKLELQRQANLLEIHSLKFYTPNLVTVSTEIDNSIGFPPPPPPMPGSDLGNTDNSSEFSPPPPPPPSGGDFKTVVFEEKSLNEVMKNVTFLNEKINIEENLFRDLIGNWLKLKVKNNGSDFDVPKFIRRKSAEFKEITTFEAFINFLKEMIDDQTLTKCNVPVFDNSTEVIEDAIALTKGFIIGKIHESRFEQNPEKEIEEYFRNDLSRIGDKISKNREDHVTVVLSKNVGANSAKTREILKEFSRKLIKETVKQREEEILMRNSNVQREFDPLDN